MDGPVERILPDIGNIEATAAHDSIIMKLPDALESSMKTHSLDPRGLVTGACPSEQLQLHVMSSAGLHTS